MWGDHTETLWRQLDFQRKGHSLPKEVDLSAPTQGDLPADLAPTQAVLPPSPLLKTLIDKYATTESSILKEDYEKYFPGNSRIHNSSVSAMLEILPTSRITCDVLKKLAAVVVRTSGRWFQYSDNDMKKMLKRETEGICQCGTLIATFAACLLLQALGLGWLVKTVYASGGGRPNWFFCKMDYRPGMKVVLGHLGITELTVPSLAAYRDSIAADTDKPARAPEVARTDDTSTTNQVEDVSEKLGWLNVDEDQGQVGPLGMGSGHGAASQVVGVAGGVNGATNQVADVAASGGGDGRCDVGSSPVLSAASHGADDGGFGVGA